jgi:hypothetical protein
MSDLINHVTWLRNRRASILAVATELADRASRANRFLGLHEQRQYEQLVAALDHIDNRLRRLWLQHRAGADSIHACLEEFFHGNSGGSFAAAPGSGVRATLGRFRR